MTNSLLRVDDLRVAVRSRGSLGDVVHGVSFELAQGEILGIVGESGSGKSLTLRAVCDLLPEGVERTGGSVDVHLPRTSTGSTAQGYLGRGMAMVFQEPMTSLNPTMRIGDLVTIGPRSAGTMTKAQARERSLELLRDVGVPDPERRIKSWPHELSGGLRQRVMIAMALATEPSILLCDEPTTALDVSVQDQILRVLMSMTSTRGLSMILVTHDLAVVSQMCDRVLVMKSGLVVESGTTADILHSPKQDYTKTLIEAVS